MNIRGVFTRFRSVLIWVMGSLLLLLLAAAAVLMFTPFADDLGKGWLERTLQKEGISFQFGEMRGTLARGIELTDIRIEKPGFWSVTAARARVEVSLLSILFGRPNLKELLLEEGSAVIAFGEDAADASEKSLPAFGVSRWELRRMSLRLLSDGDAVPWVGSWSSLDGEGSFSMAGQSLRLSARGLGAISGDSRLPALQGSGSLAWARRSGLRIEFSADFEGAVFHHSGRIQSTATAPIWKGEWTCENVDLARLGAVWPGAPSRRVGGALETELQGRQLLWTGSAAMGASGSAEGQGRLFFGPQGVEITGQATCEGFALGSPSMIPGLENLAPSGSGKVSWDVQVPPEEALRWKLAIEATNASVYHLQVERGTAEIASGGEITEITFDAGSPRATRAKGSFTIKREAGWWGQVAGWGVLLEPLLKDLGIWKEPPAGLHLPSMPWEEVELSLRQQGGRFQLSAQGRNPSVSFANFVFESPYGALPSWSLAVDDLNTISIGLSREGLLSGRLAYAPTGPESGRFQVALKRAEIDSVKFQPASFAVVERAGRWSLEPVSFSTSAGTVRLSGTLQSDGALEARVGLNLSEVEAFAGWAGISGMRGSGEADLLVAGRPGQFRISGRAAIGELEWEAFSAKRVQGQGFWVYPEGELGWRTTWEALSVSGELLGVGELKLEGPPGRVVVSLRAELGAGRELTLDGRGAFASSGLDLTVQNSRFSLVQGVVSQRGDALFQMSNAGFLLENYVLEGDLGRLALDGGFREEAEGAPEESWGRLQLEKLPLGAFPIPPTAGAIAGQVSADLSWVGTLKQPQLSGWARIEDGSYRFARSDLVWAPARIEVQAQGDRMVLTEGALASPEGGIAKATGWVLVDGLMPGAFELSCSGKSMPFVIGREVEAKSDFEVILSGTLKAPRISGRAEIQKGRILLPDVARQAPLPASVTFKNAAAGSPFAPPDQEESRVVGRLRGEVTLNSRGGFWVSNRNLLGELTGGVVAEFSEVGVRLRGELKLRHGRYIFQGRTFEISTAKILFGGIGEEEILLDVVAEYLASDGTEVTVRLFGRPERPNVQLSSRPQLDSYGILAVLLLDRRPEEMNSQEKSNWAAAAASLALQYQAEDILESATRRMGLDAVTLVTGDSGRTAGVGLTKSIGERVVVEYQQLFGAIPEERVNLRYRINRRLSFRGTSSSTEGATADLLWEKRY